VTLEANDKGVGVTLTFLKSERAIEYLRWGAAFVTVVLVYGVAGWLLLRPTGWQLGINGPVVEIDLSDSTRLAAAVAPADREIGSPPPYPPPQAREGREGAAPAGDVRGAFPGTAGTHQDVAAKDHPVEAARTQPAAPAEKASDTSTTDATGSSGASRPVAAPPRIVAPDNSNTASIMHAPIDTSISVNQGRSLLRGGAKGGPQLRGGRAPQLNLPPLVATSPLLAISKGRNDPFSKKPAPIAGSSIPVPGPAAPAANHGHTLDLAHTPLMGADGRPVRNAIGAIIEHSTVAPQAGAPLGIRSMAGASATHAPGEPGPATTPAGAPVAANTLKPGTAGLPAAAANQRQSGHPDQASLPSHLATVGGPAIGGIAMIRPGSSTGAIGGPAKAATGVLNGSNFRTRHP
jgi:hypothetical protein